MFKLNERLELDTVACNDLKLCELRVLPDSQCPWVVLIPKREEIREIFELSNEDQFLLTQEIAMVSEKLQKEFNADKMNVGALGNMVSQLHIHIICRYENDRAWPGAIWGRADNGDDKQKFIAPIKNLF